MLVLLVGFLAYDRARGLVEDVAAIERSHSVIESSDELLTRAIDAETGQRAFLLAGDEVFLDPYTGARADVMRALDSLRTLVDDVPRQRARLDSIGSAINERFVLLESGILAFHRGDMAAARSPARIMAGKRQMDQARALIGRIQFHERRLLAERHAAEERSVRNATLVVASAAIVALALSALINLAFSRAIREREVANSQLLEVNEDLQRQSQQLEMQAVEMESQAAELEATAEDLRSTNEELNQATRTAEAARDSAENARRHLELVLENLPDSASLLDSDWRWTYLNPAATRFLSSLGIDPSEAGGKALWDVVPQLKGSQFQSEVERAAREGKVAEFEYYFHPLDVWLECTVVPVTGAVMLFTRDVTRRKREQEGVQLLDEASKVLASTLDYEKTLEAVASLAVGALADWCGVDLVDTDGRIRQVRDAG